MHPFLSSAVGYLAILAIYESIHMQVHKYAILCIIEGTYLQNRTANFISQLKMN